MTLIERLKNSISNGKLCYWTRAQNETLDVMKTVVMSALKIERQQKKPREQGCNNHGLEHNQKAEDDVYDGTIDVTTIGKTIRFYIKCFFWKKSDRQLDQGVTIQSFKRE